MVTIGLENLDCERPKANALELDYTLGCSEAHAEPTESAESTLREDLKREPERADRLEAEIGELRGRSLWRRSWAVGSFNTLAARS